ncbi:SDR family oxidoreductase [Kitasatospora sp. NBC_01302]|uniref:SDR family oxidoreductase n=1 Tax=Kitasatospora sp. NBC_01302 TaxID=2903575 RepID=UPI002E0E8EE0|nr:SDR family oxidoreductase [Kitasatospora sp. NBC_01302]
MRHAEVADVIPRSATGTIRLGTLRREVLERRATVPSGNGGGAVAESAAETEAGRGTLGLKGRVAVVTGASRGLGLAAARKLCASGCDVLINYAHDDEAAAQAVESLSGLTGRAEAVKADVCAPGAVTGLLERAHERYGRVDVLVHNAAAWTPATLLAADPTVFHHDVRAALDPLLGAASALPELMSQGGRVVAVSSSGAHRVVPKYVSLGVAKAALEALVRYLAAELGRHGIVVNAVSTAKLDKGEGVPGVLGGRRLTRPEQVADAIALLCTDEADWIRGQVLTVDGGWNLSP